MIQGNYIGTDATGTRALGNYYGVSANYPHTIVGNLISGNQVGITGPGYNYPSSIFQVQGTLIGTDATGMHGIPNGIGIVSGAGTSLIGGTTAAARNVISGNSGDGVYVGTGGTVIQGNYIGTDISGTTALGNGTNGIEIQSSNNVIGGTGMGVGNTIANNAGDGVFVGSGGSGNAILGNSIHDNAGLGIHLISGGNNNQAAPVLTSASTSAGSTTISGTLQSVASTTFRVEFFANTTADPSGYGQGRTYLGFATVTTNSSGTGNFTVTLTTPLPAGQTVLSATATNQTTNDTSQFARDVSIPVVGAITAPLTPVLVNTAINVSASFADAIPSTTHTAVWNWGDNTTSAGTGTGTGGSGPVTGSHTYAVDGVYTVTLTVTNNLGGSGQSVFRYVVVYNPSAGSLNGSGVIESPAGAYAANPALVGDAHFGFHVSYDPHATVPEGHVRFDFAPAGLDFDSTSLDWLVINGGRAQVHGQGTIHGAGHYGFLLTVLDGGTGPDKFRIKIWDIDHGNTVIYDTQMGAADTADPTMALASGRITVH
jgi:titin